MDRTGSHDESFKLAELSAGATVRDGSGGSWLLGLCGLVGLVAVWLALAAGVDISARSGAETFASAGVSTPSTAPAAVVASVAAQTDRPTSEAGQVPRDGRDRPGEVQATLETETEDDDDAPSHSSAVAPTSRPVSTVDGRRNAWSSRPAIDTGHPLVSTGLARGPPVAT